MRKGILLFAGFVVILSLFLFEFIVYGGSMNYGKEYYEELKEGEILRVQNDNSILITNYDKIATTGIRYRTLGYGIKKSKDEVIGTKNGRVDEKVPLVEQRPFKILKHEDDPNIMQGYVIATDIIYSTSIYEQIGNIDSTWVNTLYSDGGIIYLDGIMTINQNGRMLGSMEYKNGKYVTSGEIYSTVDGIKNARGWIDPNALHTHYNKRVDLLPLTTRM